MSVAAQPRPARTPSPSTGEGPPLRAVAAPRERSPGRFAAWLRGTVGAKGDRSYRLRLLIQGGFALGCVVLGVQFARFTRAAAAGELPLPARPPGVEGFLPISGMMGLLDWIYQGTLNRVHPAATMLFVIVVAVAFFARKSFCSWICPVGLLSESLARLGRRLFGRNLRPWRWLDVSLRGLKYLLLFFFVQAIAGMGAAGLRAFIESPYNRVADVKMGLFFARLGPVGAGVLAVLVVLSILVHGAWCRYLCPYGALLGLFSRFSPLEVERHADACVDCGLCDRVCMARLPVSKVDRVTSVECTGCLDCVATCPVPGALEIKAARRWRLTAPAFALVVVILFMGGYSGARLAGLWQSDLSAAEYSHRIRNLDRPEYGHPGSGNAADGPMPPATRRATKGFGPPAALLVVDDGTASTPPRALHANQNPLSRDHPDFYHGLLGLLFENQRPGALLAANHPHRSAGGLQPSPPAVLAPSNSSRYSP